MNFTFGEESPDSTGQDAPHGRLGRRERGALRDTEENGKCNRKQTARIEARASGTKPGKGEKVV